MWQGGVRKKKLRSASLPLNLDASKFQVFTEPFQKDSLLLKQDSLDLGVTISHRPFSGHSLLQRDGNLGFLCLLSSWLRIIGFAV